MGGGTALPLHCSTYPQIVFDRWWRQYSSLPWPDSLALQLHGLVLPDKQVSSSLKVFFLTDVQEEAAAYIHNFMRLTLASYVLCLRSVWSSSPSSGPLCFLSIFTSTPSDVSVPE